MLGKIISAELEKLIAEHKAEYNKLNILKGYNFQNHVKLTVYAKQKYLLVEIHLINLTRTPQTGCVGLKDFFQKNGLIKPENVYVLRDKGGFVSDIKEMTRSGRELLGLKHEYAHQEGLFISLNGYDRHHFFLRIDL